MESSSTASNLLIILFTSLFYHYLIHCVQLTGSSVYRVKKKPRMCRAKGLERRGFWLCAVYHVHGVEFRAGFFDRYVCFQHTPHETDTDRVGAARVTVAAGVSFSDKADTFGVNRDGRTAKSARVVIDLHGSLPLLEGTEPFNVLLRTQREWMGSLYRFKRKRQAGSFSPMISRYRALPGVRNRRATSSMLLGSSWGASSLF